MILLIFKNKNMKLRDKLNTEERYNEIISIYKGFVDDEFEDIRNLQANERIGVLLYPPTPNNEVIIGCYDNMFLYQKAVMFASYSIGKEINDVRKEYILLVDTLSWAKGNCHNGKYVEIIWLLSIGIMLNIEDEHFNKLLHLVEQYNPNDYLIDFLINYRFPSWERKATKFFWNRPYSFLEQIIVSAQSGKTLQAKEKLLEYLKKKWYKGHNDKAWYNNHTGDSSNNPHDGYWSFESGALVKILGLDDSDWQDLPYYPYDMVHYK